MKNTKLDTGFLTTNIDLAAAMLCQDGVEFAMLGGEGNEREFVLKGDPEVCEAVRKAWFSGTPAGNMKHFAENRRTLLKLLPRRK